MSLELLSALTILIGLSRRAGSFQPSLAFRMFVWCTRQGTHQKLNCVTVADLLQNDICGPTHWQSRAEDLRGHSKSGGGSGGSAQGMVQLLSRCTLLLLDAAELQSHKQVHPSDPGLCLWGRRADNCGITQLWAAVQAAIREWGYVQLAPRLCWVWHIMAKSSSAILQRPTKADLLMLDAYTVPSPHQIIA